MKWFRKDYSIDYKVDHKIHSLFIDTFNDVHPFHIDDKVAQSAGFPHKIMHGNILCGFLSNFVGTRFEKKNVVIATQSIKFHHPVFLNDTVKLKVKVIDYVESVGVFNIEFRFTKHVEELKVASGKILLKTI